MLEPCHGLPARPAAACIAFAGARLDLELAASDAARTLGLSGRAWMAADKGLWMVFARPGLYGIWMKDMHLSIDILWLNDDRTIVHIEEQVSPDSYPRIFTPPVPARFVLETAAGFVSEHQIKLGDRGSSDC